MGDKQSKGKKDPYAGLYDASFEMRMQSKALEKEANRVRMKSEAEKKKAAAMMQKGDIESAKLYAAQTISLQKESNNILRMSGKLSAVSAKLDQAYRT